MLNPEDFNRRSHNHLPGLLGIVVTHVGAGELRAHLQVRADLMAPNGFLHAGTVVTLADTCAGYGCLASLPAAASGFTTIELKSNHLGTARGGQIECVAKAMHLGKTTQVWDALVSHGDKTIAIFRCTQMLLYPKAA